MCAKPAGEQEILYFGPGQICAGLDYSLPYNCLAPNSLADGTVNTTQINGFVTSAPWMASSPWSTAFAAGEFVLGYFNYSTLPNYTTALSPKKLTVIVTNIAVYISPEFTPTSPTLSPINLTVLHTWNQSTEIVANFCSLGNAVSFVEVNGTIYFTGLMLKGIFGVSNPPLAFFQATNYVAGAYIIELAGRLVVAQCIFPGGGGTGVNPLPTVAWSGVGAYSGSGGTDPWNPVNNLGGGFNELSDVPDQVTGLVGLGRSALIFRLQGISQQDPNPGTSNSGLQPFNFYHLWASPQGVGAYPGSVAQFGYTAYFLSSDNAYSINLYAGPQPIGPRIIPKIKQDLKKFSSAPGYTPTPGSAVLELPFPPFWYFGSVVNISGQLHYLLSFSGNTASPPPASTTTVSVAKVYDFNISENAWHIWDFSKYIQTNSTAPFSGFTCPLFQSAEQNGYDALGNILKSCSFEFIFAGMANYNPAVTANQINGATVSLVPFDYNFNSQWLTAFNTALYTPLALPLTTLVFRGEVVAVGKRNSERRVLIQADNAPIPVATGPAVQQQGNVTLTGSFAQSTASSALNWTQGGGKTQPYMQGNYAPLGLPIQTYYADLVLSDEMIQVSLSSVIADPANPWNSLAAFRLTTAMLILESTKGSIQ